MTALVFLFQAACLLDQKTHDSFINGLQEEESLEEMSDENTHYLFYGSNDSCLIFDEVPEGTIPFGQSAWGFSFRLPVVPTTEKSMTTFKRGSRYLTLFHTVNSISLRWCDSTLGDGLCDRFDHGVVSVWQLE